MFVMRTFIVAIILIFSFQSWGKADDIRDFQIEGMSIGDSLLDYATKDEIEKNKYFFKEQKNKEYAVVNLKNININIKNSELYDKVTATFRTSDGRYKIKKVEGIIWFIDDINSCLKKRDEIIKELSDLFKNNRKEDTGKKEHSADKDKKSYTYSYDVYFGNINDWPLDLLSVSCFDWSKKMKYWDHLRLRIMTKEYIEWLKK